MNSKLDWIISNIRELSGRIVKKTIAQRKNIAKFAAGIIILMIASFLIEYFVFGYKLNVAEQGNDKLYSIEKSDIKIENFILNEKGEYVSMEEGATLTIQARGKYINNLALDLGKKPNYAIDVIFEDPKTLNHIVLKNQVESSMLKNNMNFLDIASYKIQNNPSEITIKALKSQLIISEISIDNNYLFNIYRFSFILAVISLLSFFILFRKMIGKKPETAFFVVAMICGTLISFTGLKTYLSWDELVHYKRAENISVKKAFQDRNNIYAKTNYVPVSFSLREQEKIDYFVDNEYVAERKNRKESYSFFEAYNSMGYVPSAIAMLAGRALNLPVGLIFILGKWINILVFSVVVYFAIKKLKSGKMLMAVIALFPTTIFLAYNYGYDYWVIAFSLLGLSYFFSEFQQPEKKLEKRSAGIMIFSFFLGLAPKPIYFPLMFLLFLMPSSKFKGEKQYRDYILICAATLVFVVSSFMLPFLIDGPGKGDIRGGELVNSAEQVKFIISEPLAYSKILFNFAVNYSNPLNYGAAIVSFANSGTVKGFVAMLLILFVVAVSDRSVSDERTSGWKFKILILCIYFVTVSLISSALYVAFTAVRSEVIEGVQTRYLIPLIFPLFYGLFGFRIKNPINRNVYNFIIFGLVSAVLLYGIWTLIVKNYY